MINDTWSSPWNPFNSAKILMWGKYIEACLTGEYLVPPMVDIDLCPNCNFLCDWCNARGILANKKELLSTEHYLKVIDLLKDWRIGNNPERVLSACISGGGESLMHPGHNDILTKLHENGIKTGLITNGSLVGKKEVEIIAETCQWVGFSMDAATSDTYKKIKGIKADIFTKVCENLKALATEYNRLGKVNGVCFKFLLSPENYTEIYEAAKLAKSLGVHDFHLRPVGYQHLVNKEETTVYYTEEMLYTINKQIEAATGLEDNTFKVYGIRHKFSPDLQPVLKFNKCRLIPMLPTFGADGKVHTCFDMRGREDLIMCNHLDVKDYWNSSEHKKLIDTIDIKSCPRCTFNTYHEIVEKVFIEDNMYRKFL